MDTNHRAKPPAASPHLRPTITTKPVAIALRRRLRDEGVVLPHGTIKFGVLWDRSPRGVAFYSEDELEVIA